MRVSAPGEHDDPVAAIGQHLAPELVKAGSAFSHAIYKHSTLSLREFEGARARTAEINGCVVCRAFRAKRDLVSFFDSQGVEHARSVIDNGEAPDEDFYLNVSNWRTWPGYSERERLAIEYAEGFGTDPQGLAKNEDFWKRAKTAFTDYEIVDLSYCTAAWVGMGRVAHVLGIDAACMLPPAEARAAE
jgi:alkylhydroperoxidase family enzyme